jgi:hypothetical protein
MKRAAILVAAAFLAGVGIGGYVQSARTATQVQKDTRAADMAAIERLHRADVEATLTQDQSYLTALWSEDAINLGFPGPPVVGVKAMGEAYAKRRLRIRSFEC